MYKKSNYLIVKKSKVEKNSYFIYHSIFGNLLKINEEMYNYIFSSDNFSEEELLKNFTTEDFNFLKSNYFITKTCFDEQNLINKKIELRKSSLEEGKEFDKLQLIMTNACNFKCKYCFCEQFTKEKNNLAMSYEIADLSILNSIKILKANNKKNLYISFFGGEPSLNLKVIQDILLKFKNHYLGIDIFYEYTSNGSIMSDNIASLFKKYNVVVTFSIDYLDKKTFSFRGNGNETFKWAQIENNIKLLKEKDVELEISSVLSEETMNKDFINLVDVLLKYNINRIYLILSFGKEFYRKYSPNEISKKVFEYYIYCLSKGISLEGYWNETFCLIVDSERLKKQEAHKTCPSIGKMLSIEPSGTIFSCKTTNKILGNIFELEKVFKNENYQYYAMRAYVNSEKCKGCEIQGFCSGNCTGANENNFGTIYEVDPLFCSTMKKIINFLLEHYINEEENLYD